jgi:hypothetical protein
MARTTTSPEFSPTRILTTAAERVSRACHGVRSHPVPVALVGECSVPSYRRSPASLVSRASQHRR